MTEIRTGHSFDVPCPPEDAWRLLRRVSLDGRTTEPGEWWLPGFASRCTELASEVGSHLQVRKEDEPCAGTTIDVTIEHTPSGSSIRVVQSGFDPAFVEMAGEGFWLHAEHMAADFELALRQGVVVDRAWRWPQVDLGLACATVDAAVAVSEVRAGTWATRAGLAVGDVVVGLAGASIYTARDLETVRQTVADGSEVSVEYVRDAAVCDAVAVA